MKLNVTVLFYFVLLSVLLVSVSPATAETVYKLLVDTYGFTMENSPPGDTTRFYASFKSRFVIVNDLGSDLLIRFTGGIDPPDSLEQYSTSSAHVVKDVHYLISKEILTEHKYELAFGFAWGTLTVPVKIQLGDGNMVTGTTLGAYAGRIQTIWHIPFTVLASAGPAVIPISEVGTNGVATELGWSYAFGLLIEPIRHAQIGILIGADHVVGDTGRNYRYQDKLWISFAIGYNFSH